MPHSSYSSLSLARVRIGRQIVSPHLIATSVVVGFLGCSSDDRDSPLGSASSGGALIESSSGGASGDQTTSSGGGDATNGSGGAFDGQVSGGTTGSGGIDGSGGDSMDGSGGESSSGTPSNCSETLAADDTDRLVSVDGMDRSFIMRIPSGYTGSDPVPLVIDFHPLGGSGTQERGSSGLGDIANQEGFIILWPDGIDNAWNVGPCCTNSRDIDDVAFARAMVDDLISIACVDQKRVYSTGFSMGGGMSHYLACHAADVFAAVAPSGFDLLEENVDGCVPARPISVFSIRGSMDTTAPFNGGPGPSGQANFLGAQGTLEKWAELNGCTGDPSSDGGTQLYESCNDGVEVGLLTLQAGHAWGPSDVAWDFLKTKSLP